MKDLSTLTLWDLAYELNVGNPELCGKIDPHLANKLDSLDSLGEIYFYLCCGGMHSFLPKTKSQINKLLADELNKDNEEVAWRYFKHFVDWLNKDMQDALAYIWLDNDEIDMDDSWMISSLPADSETGLKTLTKLVRLYKKRKNSHTIKLIEDIYMNLDKTHAKKGSEIIAKSTPAVSVALLKRSDIPEKYAIKGLRSLGKLSKQRSLDIKIDFDMLKHLGPKSRLDAMKQLMGMFDRYYTFKRQQAERKKTNPNYRSGWWEQRKERKLKAQAVEPELPFTTAPTRSDIEKFLFPCSLKYNDQVVEMMQRFDELIGQKEEE